MIGLEQIGEKISSSKAILKIKSQDLLDKKMALRRTTRNIQQSKDARIILQNAAVLTQEQLGQSFSNLVTLAEASVFPNPYEFKAKFIQRRNTSECDLYFERGDKQYAILGGTGGGAVDVANFALRISYLSTREGTRLLVILDEPFKNINDPKRILHKKCAEMVLEVSRLSKFQIIMVSQIPEMAEIADKLITVDQNDKGESFIVE